MKILLFGFILLSFLLLTGAAEASGQTCPCPVPIGLSIWGPTATPKLIDSTDTKAVELGVKFTSSQAGVITGIRFYKSAKNIGIHTGNLWTATGTQLASAVFINETASGWQQVIFLSPVTINPNTTYIASYFAPLGHYSDDRDFFTTAGVTNGPLTALANTVTPNGVYKYGATSAFPNTTTNPSQYWVDVAFTARAPTPIAPTLTSAITAAGTVGSVFAYQITADGLPTSFGAAGLPVGLVLNSTSGMISGTPTAAAVTTVTLTAVNGVGTGTRNLTLTVGPVVVPPPHATVITWNASTSSGVRGYNVYVATTAGGPYSVLGSGVTGLTLTDSAVVSGQRKYYMVRTVGSDGKESANSIEASAVTPTP